MGGRAFSHRFRERLRKSWPLVVVIAGGLLIEAGFTTSVPLAFKALIDQVITPRDTRLLVPILSLLAAGMISAVLAGLIRDYAYARVSSALLSDLRHDMFRHLLQWTPGQRQLGDQGEIAARFSTDLAAVEHALLAALPWAGLPALEALLCVVLLFVLDWRLALLAMLVFPLALAGPRFLAARATAASYARKQDESRVLGALHESLGAQAAVKAFGLEARLLEQFGERLRTLVGSSTRTAFLGALVERSASIGILILHVGVLGIGTVMTLDGQLSVGSLVSFQSLFLTLSWSLSYMAQYTPNLVLASGAMRRIDELFALAPQVADAADAVALPRFARTIRFEHVTFGFNADRLSLADVSFEVREGERIAIVGGVGSGKSTVVKMLTRFRDPQAGRVLIDGHDLRAVSQASLRSQIGLVLQEGFLFDATIRENIRLGMLSATDSEIEAVAGLIGLHDQIQHLPLRYDTRVGRAWRATVGRTTAAGRDRASRHSQSADLDLRRGHVGARQQGRGAGRNGDRPCCPRPHGARRHAPARLRTARGSHPGDAARAGLPRKARTTIYWRAASSTHNYGSGERALRARCQGASGPGAKPTLVAKVPLPLLAPSDHWITSHPTQPSN